MPYQLHFRQIHKKRSVRSFSSPAPALWGLRIARNCRSGQRRSLTPICLSFVMTHHGQPYTQSCRDVKSRQYTYLWASSLPNLLDSHHRKLRSFKGSRKYSVDTRLSHGPYPACRALIWLWIYHHGLFRGIPPSKPSAIGFCYESEAFGACRSHSFPVISGQVNGIWHKVNIYSHNCKIKLLNCPKNCPDKKRCPYSGVNWC